MKILLEDNKDYFLNEGILKFAISPPREAKIELRGATPHVKGTCILDMSSVPKTKRAAYYLKIFLFK